MGAWGAVEIRLFGQVEIIGPSGSVTPAGNKQRAVLARLALDPQRVVAADSLIDDVWGWDPPESVRSALQVHVSQLRRILRSVGAGDVIRTRPPGYVLDVPASAVDVLRFEQLAIDAGQAALPATDVLAAATAAETLWVGAPMSALGTAPFTDAVRTRLDDRRIALACARSRAAIVCGRAVDIVADLEALASQHPYVEPLWVALAGALHAAGRHHDALAKLATLRRTLADDLGLVPGSDVGRLELEILTHDPVTPSATSAPAAAVDATTRAGFPSATALRGRDELLDHLASLLTAPGLVTLVGPAGVGKTSTAVHAARATGSRPFDPQFVDLAAVMPGQPVEPAVAAAIGLQPSSPEALTDEVLALLHDRDQLIVLDNCEHVADGAAALAARLGSAPRLTVLATSRLPLNCRHERVVHVEPLDHDVLTELFVERARLASSRFEPDGPEATAISELVARLDGLPLGVELVAPLVRSMSPTDIVRQTDLLQLDLLDLDGGGPAIDRHRTLATAISWSLGLLSPGQRTLLTRLAVFAGGALATSVVAVCADDADGGATIGGDDVLGLLRSLVDASLVIADRTPSGTWYRMLFPIREHAERLLGQDDAHRTALAERHARHVVALVQEAAADVAGPEPLAGIRRFEQQASEIRRAHLWFDHHGDLAGVVDLLAPMGPPAMGATAALPELSRWLIAATTAATESHRVGTTPRPERLLWVQLGAAKQALLEPEAQAALLRAAEETAVQVGDTAGQVVAAALRGELVGDADATAGSEVCRAALQLARRYGDPVVEAFALLYAANMTLRARRLDDALDVLADAMSGDTSRYGILEPHVVCQLGRLRMVNGDLAGAQAMYERGERLARGIGSLYGVSWAVFGQSEVARRQGRFADARSLGLTSAELDRLVAPREEWMGLGRLAGIAVRLDDEALLADIVRRLHDRTGPFELVTLEVARGCLAACRGARPLALQHLRHALERLCEMGAVEQFAELVATYGFVEVGDESWTLLGDSVCDGRVTMDDVLARLAA